MPLDMVPVRTPGVSIRSILAELDSTHTTWEATFRLLNSTDLVHPIRSLLLLLRPCPTRDVCPTRLVPPIQTKATLTTSSLPAPHTMTDSTSETLNEVPPNRFTMRSPTHPNCTMTTTNDDPVNPSSSREVTTTTMSLHLKDLLIKVTPTHCDLSSLERLLRLTTISSPLPTDSSPSNLEAATSLIHTSRMTLAETLSLKALPHRDHSPCTLGHHPSIPSRPLSTKRVLPRH